MNTCHARVNINVTLGHLLSSRLIHAMITTSAITLPEDIMARNNRTRRQPQRMKHRVEDAMARRALHRIAEQSYRDEARQETHINGHLAVVTFTDPSFA